MNLILESIVFFGLFLYYILEGIVLLFVPSRFRMKSISGQRVLITGAGSGLGRLMSHRFAKLGCSLILWDINREANEETAAQVRELGAEAHAYKCDLSNREEIYRCADKVKSDIGDVDILVNNAGVVTGKKFLDCPDSLIIKTMEVNTMAHFWTVKAFLPAMLHKNRGHIVSIASGAGHFGIGGLCDYCASKFAAYGFDESLRAELVAQKKTGVHTTVVCPSYIDTGMFSGVTPKSHFFLPILEPPYVVDKIIEAVLTNQNVLCVPRVFYFMIWMKNMIPTKALTIVDDFIGLSKSMTTFRGRSKAD